MTRSRSDVVAFVEDPAEPGRGCTTATDVVIVADTVYFVGDFEEGYCPFFAFEFDDFFF